MKASMWGVLLIIIGMIGITLMVFFGQVSTSNDQTFYSLKEVTEAAMYDAVDLVAYRAGYTDPDTGTVYQPGVIRLDKDRFIEMFSRRYAESVDNTRNYKISFYEINEFPPKVTLRVQYGEDTRILGFDTQDYEFTITKDMVAILEGRG